MEARRPVVGVELQPGGARVAVARLADAAGVEQPGALVEVEQRRRRPPGRRARSRGRAPPSGRVKKSATCEWPIRPIRSAWASRPGFGLVDREHVLPDRVARGGVEEAEAVVRERRREAARGTRSSPRSAPLAGPLDRHLRGLREGRDVERAEHRQVVVADQADLAALADQRRAGVGIGAVADQVAEAPDLLDAGRLDRREDGLEGGQVGVDVADDGYAQAASVLRVSPGPYDGRVSTTDSIAELRGAVERAARALRDGEPTEPEPIARPPAEARARRLQLQRGDAARRPARRQPARRRRAPAGRARGEPRRRRRARPDRGRRPRLRQPLPRRRLVPARARRAGRRREPRPGADRRAGADPGRVRLRQPDRPAARRRRPPRRLRRRSWRGCWRRSATRSSASSTSTTPAPRSTASPTRSPPGWPARSCPRTATRAST